MNDEDKYTIDRMTRHGGSFVTCLAQAARVADSDNLQRIKTEWPELWRKYGPWGIFAAREESEL